VSRVRMTCEVYGSEVAEYSRPAGDGLRKFSSHTLKLRPCCVQTHKLMTRSIAVETSQSRGRG
jgi:hypothetical protein